MAAIDEPAYLKIVEAIGDRVKVVRNSLQITQKELAKRLALSQSYISAVEAGKNKANVDLVAGLIIFFPDINPGWLLTGRGPMLMERGGAVPRDDYNLDVAALKIADNLFYDEFHKRQGDEHGIARLMADRHFFINMIYRTYMSHYHALLARGMPEAEARALAKAECEQLDKRGDGGQGPQ